MNALIGPYEEAGFDVIAVSMDSLERAQQSMDDWDIGNITIGYGLTEATAGDWGLYISKVFKEGEADTFIEPGLFWVRPDGRLYLTDISNMPWCRPDFEFLYSKNSVCCGKRVPCQGHPYGLKEARLEIPGGISGSIVGATLNPAGSRFGTCQVFAKECF